MAIRCFLPLSQWDAYLMIYRKYYYKWIKTFVNGCGYYDTMRTYTTYEFIIGVYRCLRQNLLDDRSIYSITMLNLSCYDNNIYIVKIIINYLIIYNYSYDFQAKFECVCENNNIEIMKLIITATKGNLDYDDALSSTSRCNEAYKFLIKLLYQKYWQ